MASYRAVAALAGALITVLPLAACDRGPSYDAPPSRPVDTSARDADAAVAAEKEHDVAIEREARLTALEAQVADLEKQVGELKASRQQVDGDLVNQRLSALEAADLANGEAPATGAAHRAPAPTPAPTPAQPSGRRPLSQSEVIDRLNQQ